MPHVKHSANRLAHPQTGRGQKRIDIALYFTEYYDSHSDSY